VSRFLKQFTLRPLDEIAHLSALRGAELREAKKILAHDATAITHGKAAADEAADAARAAFGSGGDLEGMPTTTVSAEQLAEGIPLTTLLSEVGLTRSRGAARRMIAQGGAYVNDERISDVNHVVRTQDLTKDGILLRVGKKRLHRLIVE
jgi:tyrosyl-tRNA synthetase